MTIVPQLALQLIGLHRISLTQRFTDGYAGRRYKSLSAIARTITGTRWNGWTFFGLRKQARQS